MCQPLFPHLENIKRNWLSKQLSVFHTGLHPVLLVSKVGDCSRVTQRFPFQQLLHQGVGEGATPFPGLLHFTFDPYLKMLSIKQGSIKYHFLESLV